MKSDSKNIADIVKDRLCVQCGTCVGVCPTKAITIQEFRKTGLLFPIVDDDLCIDCGLCNEVCPVNDFSLYTEPVKDFKSINILETSTNDEGEQISSSGGAVSEILKYLFRKGYIDKAVVAVMQRGNVLEPLATIITSEAEVDQSRGSIYQPIAMNKVLNQISRKDKVAVVGLPCHIRGLAQFLNESKKIKEANVYKIGIFCNIGRSKNATRFLLKKYSKKEKGNINFIYYRKGDYPGYLNLEFDSDTVSVPYKEYMTRTGYFFTPRGCLFCDDLFNEKADISVGDPWGLVDKKEALVIARSTVGDKIVGEMLKSGIFKLDRELDRQAAINTQNYKHKKNRAARANIYRKFGIPIPLKFKTELATYKDYKTSAFNSILSIILLFNSAVFNSRFYNLASILPLKLLSKLSTSIKTKYRTGDTGKHISGQ